MCIYIVKLENNNIVFLDKSILLNPLNWNRDDIYIAIDFHCIKKVFSNTYYVLED